MFTRNADAISRSRHSERRTGGSGRGLVYALCLWGLGVVGSIGSLDRYANAPGDPGEAPGRWPSATSITRRPGRPALVMFIHPRCPCTRASLEELARLLANCRRMADVHGIFVVPEGYSATWARSDLWRLASTIPDVQVMLDWQGCEARRFGAATSGLVQLYDSVGSLVFSGGVTGARNHEGNNAGAGAVYAWLRRGSADRRDAFVFGCPLFDSSEEPR